MQISHPIPVASIKPSHLRVRRELDQDKLNELSISMKTIGQLQNIGIFKTTDGYELIFGERRLEAAKLLGWQKIEAKVFEAKDDRVILAIMATENLQSEKLKTIESVEIVRRLIDCGFDVRAIAETLFESWQWVKNHEFVLRNSTARAIAEAGSLLDAESLARFQQFPASIRKMMMELA